MTDRRPQNPHGTRVNPPGATPSRPGRVAISESLNSAFIEVFARRNVAGPDEDPNISAVAYASPPCFMHELSPDFADHGASSTLLPLLQDLYECWMAGIPVLTGLREAVTGGEISKALHGICIEDIRFCEFLREQLLYLGATVRVRGGDNSAQPLHPQNAHDELRALCEGRDRMVHRMSMEIPAVREYRLRSELSAMISAHQRRTHVVAVAEALLLLNHP
jgi:hypothetical protein